MPTAFPNLIDGRRSTRPIASTEHQSLQPQRRRRRIRARHDVATPSRRSPRRATAFAKWSRTTPQERFDILDRAGTEILARKEELGRLLSREQGKPLADGIGEAARAGRDLQVLRRRGAAPDGREARLRAARHRGRSHPRAGRRRRGHHAVEFSARDSGVEDRAGAGVRQLRRLQAGGARAGVAVDAGGHRAARGPAAGRAQSRDGAGLEARRGARRRRRTSTR